MGIALQQAIYHHRSCDCSFYLNRISRRPERRDKSAHLPEGTSSLPLGSPDRLEVTTKKLSDEIPTHRGCRTNSTSNPASGPAPIAKGTKSPIEHLSKQKTAQNHIRLCTLRRKRRYASRSPPSMRAPQPQHAVALLEIALKQAELFNGTKGIRTKSIICT